MQKPTILVTGKNGQVGFELQRSLAQIGDVVAVDIDDCDLSDAVAIVDLVERVKPDLIVNPAAYTAVDKAETDTETAFAINANAPKILAAQANLRNISLIHYSTDYIFDGTKKGWYMEDDIPNPQSIYGITKWQGEKNVRAICPKHIILRTSWVYGVHGENFLKTILRLAQERSSLNIVSDQFGVPTSARLLADTTTKIAQRILDGDENGYGTYHLVPEGEASWFEYAKKVVQLANKEGMITKVSPDAINGIATDAYPLPAIRPRNSKLSTKKIKQTYSVELPNWETELEIMVKKVIRFADDKKR